MTENTTDPAKGPTGKMVELGHYELAEGERVLIGRRIHGVVKVFDAPADGEGRRYLVEAGIGSKAELAALVCDYKRQAQRIGRCPMAPGAAFGAQLLEELEEAIA